jgi:hypothetical protein
MAIRLEFSSKHSKPRTRVSGSSNLSSMRPAPTKPRAARSAAAAAQEALEWDWEEAAAVGAVVLGLEKELP